MNGDFVYLIDGVERRFIIKTYATRKIIEERAGGNVLGLLELFTISESSLINTTLAFMYHSAVFGSHADKKPVDFVELDMDSWVDTTGGFSGEFYRLFQKELLEVQGLKKVESAENQPGSEAEEEKKN